MHGAGFKRPVSTERDQPRWLRGRVQAVCDWVDTRAGSDLASTALVLCCLFLLVCSGVLWLAVCGGARCPGWVWLVCKLMFWSKQLFGKSYEWLGSARLGAQSLTSRSSHELWRMAWGGFWLDECFARLLEVVYRQIFVLPAILVLDKWLSAWMGAPLARAAGAWLSSRLFVERASVPRVLNMLLASVLVAALFVGQLVALV